MNIISKKDNQKQYQTIAPSQKQDVYLLESNEFLTSNELFQGLAKIGIEYGRSTSNQDVIR